MLFLAESLLKAAGFEYDEIEETWVARMPLRPLVAVECDEDRSLHPGSTDGGSNES